MEHRGWVFDKVPPTDKARREVVFQPQELWQGSKDKALTGESVHGVVFARANVHNETFVAHEAQAFKME